MRFKILKLINIQKPNDIKNVKLPGRPFPGAGPCNVVHIVKSTVTVSPLLPAVCRRACKIFGECMENMQNVSFVAFLEFNFFVLR